MRESTEITYLIQIRQELQFLSKGLRAAYTGGWIPSGVEQRMKKLDKLIAFLSKEIDFMTKAQWEGKGDEL
jgi:hypothetical protein